MICYALKSESFSSHSSQLSSLLPEREFRWHLSTNFVFVCFLGKMYLGENECECDVTTSLINIDKITDSRDMF